MKRSLVIAALLAAAPAQADLWKRASEPNDPASDTYTALMLKGDEATGTANSSSVGMSLAVRQVDLALEAYRGAAKLKPTSAEPWFRIASTIDSFFVEGCDRADLLFRDRAPPATCELVDPTSPALRPHAAGHRDRKTKGLLDAWDTFESLAPLDPRVNQVLYRRAILRTKQLGTTMSPKLEPTLRAVIKDYEALLDRKDGLAQASDEGITGNLAETYLMLGEPERAIELYREAIRLGAGVSTIYGLAVALDRDGRLNDALAVIRSQGEQGREDFTKLFRLGAIFFVPEGEVEYYFALAAEAFGEIREATQHWRRFIQSGAHPQYQKQAQEHLARLTLRKTIQIDVPLTKDLGDDELLPKRRRN